MSDAKRHEFQAEVKQLLHLMIHSLYSHKDIFLRELISNASDALDRLRFEQVTNEALQGGDELHIRLEPDKGERTLTIHDNGIGMTRDEVINNLGTIAKSGTKTFLSQVKAGEGTLPPELIGQFGVGFYASFMVADKVEVLTRRAGEEAATRWVSTGDAFDVEDATREAPGTSITLAPQGEERGRQPRRLHGRLGPQAASSSATRTSSATRSSSAFGKTRARRAPRPSKTRRSTHKKRSGPGPKDEVTDEEYNEFYRHISPRLVGASRAHSDSDRRHLRGAGPAVHSLLRPRSTCSTPR